jgi:DNA-binding response OmpR family regulator
MPDRDAANSLPDGGNVSAVSKVKPSDEVQALAQPQRMQSRDASSLQHILLVEDDASLARLEAGVLSAHGYTVAIAGNGELAMMALSKAIPDLVLLDLDLPGRITGWDVLQALRTDTQTCATPVLLTSSEDSIRKQIRASGETRSTLDLLPKPYPMQALLRRIERMFTINPGGY